MNFDLTVVKVKQYLDATVEEELRHLRFKGRNVYKEELERLERLLQHVLIAMKVTDNFTIRDVRQEKDTIKYTLDIKYTAECFKAFRGWDE